MTAETKIITHHRRKWRKFWLGWHLYLGLTAGLVFVLAGLTGSLLVFYVELDEWLNPPLQISSAQTQSPLQSYQAILDAIQAAHPDRTGAWRLEVPRHPQAMLTARYYKPAEKAGLTFAPLLVWVNPYTAEVVSSRFWGEFAMTWLFDLHYALLLDETGKNVMGLIGVVLLIPLFSGIYLWWPSLGKWRQALTIKPNASFPRLIYDWHKTAGVYSAIILLLLVITGVVLELPAFFKPWVNKISPLYQPALKPYQQPSDPRWLSVDQAVSIATQHFPTAMLRWIETPEDANGVFRVMFYQNGEPSLRFPKTMVWLNPYSGAVLAVRNPKQDYAGDTFFNWLHPLHNGEVAGLPGRWLVFVSGLIPAVLYVTGLLRWRQKRQASDFKSK